MSRIGKNPVEVPDGVEVLVSGQQVNVKGKLGELTETLAPEVEITREENKIGLRHVMQRFGLAPCGVWVDHLLEIWWLVFRRVLVGS